MNNENNNNQNNNQNGGWNFGQTIFRTLLIYFVVSSFIKPLMQPPPAAPNNDGAPPAPVLPHVNTWRTGEVMTMWIYMSEDKNLTLPATNNSSSLVLHKQFLYTGDFAEYTLNLTIDQKQHPKLFRNESMMFAHVFLTKGIATPKDGIGNNIGHPDIAYKKKALGLYILENKAKAKVNLISGEAKSEEETLKAEEQRRTGQRRLLLHWVPELTLRIVDDHTAYPKGQLPPHILKTIVFDRNSNYYPVVYFHDFWATKEKMIVVNESVDTLPLQISIAPMSNWWWQLFCSMEQSFNMHEQMGTMEESSKDEFKKILLEGNPYLLAVTMVVSVFHTIFDFLAFKNDISFWRKVDSLEGLSVRTIFLNVFCQAVIFLYLVDNDTSMMILVSSGVGLLIEIWKIQKACDVKVNWRGILPVIAIKDRSSYSSKTKTYDRIAVKYLAYVLYPCVLGYSMYSVFHDTHKSWYSWILSTLVGSVYTFGFIMMTPQLFINYKLKSVAHLPWRAMMYKFLNTIIDDLFAFVITMPLMHRLSCFRDDIIFLIYLGQRWKYRVDMSRVNEYGQAGDRDAFEAAREEEKKQAITNVDTVSS